MVLQAVVQRECSDKEDTMCESMPSQCSALKVTATLALCFGPQMW